MRKQVEWVKNNKKRSAVAGVTLLLLLGTIIGSMTYVSAEEKNLVEIEVKTTMLEQMEEEMNLLKGHIEDDLEDMLEEIEENEVAVEETSDKISDKTSDKISDKTSDKTSGTTSNSGSNSTSSSSTSNNTSSTNSSSNSTSSSNTSTSTTTAHTCTWKESTVVTKEAYSYTEDVTEWVNGSYFPADGTWIPSSEGQAAVTAKVKELLASGDSSQYVARKKEVTTGTTTVNVPAETKTVYTCTGCGKTK